MAKFKEGDTVVCSAWAATIERVVCEAGISQVMYDITLDGSKKLPKAYHHDVGDPDFTKHIKRLIDKGDSSLRVLEGEIALLDSAFIGIL